MVPEPVGSTHLRFGDARVVMGNSMWLPEWSGGEDRYIGRRVLESGSVPGVPGYGQYDRKVFREP